MFDLGILCVMLTHTVTVWADGLRHTDTCGSVTLRGGRIGDIDLSHDGSNWKFTEREPIHPEATDSFFEKITILDLCEDGTEKGMDNV